jgi:histidinol-phosphate/aromatic aminotransferase/cobyric acid decarboxylase-like protein
VAAPVTLPAGDHGGDGITIARHLGVPVADIIDLSMSLNPVAPDVAAIVGSCTDAVGRYPDPAAATVALAAAVGVPTDRVVLTNGGAEAIALVAAELGAGDVVDPEFSLYRRHLAEVRRGAGRWRSNPSNPLGQLAAADDVAEVWDEAFWPLATGTWSRGDDTAWRLGSLTKLWACPGLRLGYVIAPDAAAAASIAARQPRWAVNALALAVVEPVLAMTDLCGWATTVAAIRVDLAGTLAAQGHDVVATAANWLLVRSTAPLRDRLAAEGVVVRDCTNFGLAGVFRVAVPQPDHVARVVAAFAAVGP